jgi:hypothetical protein
MSRLVPLRPKSLAALLSADAQSHLSLAGQEELAAFVRLVVDEALLTQPQLLSDLRPKLMALVSEAATEKPHNNLATAPDGKLH